MTTATPTGAPAREMPERFPNLSKDGRPCQWRPVCDTRGWHECWPHGHALRPYMERVRLAQTGGIQ